MSKYKPLYSSIWTDNQFENYSPEKKLVYIFLLTNQYVEKSGIYKVSVRQIAFNTSVTNDIINDIINDLINEDKIQYDFKEGIIFIKNLFKYQKGMIKNENILLLTLKRNYELVKTEFWNEFFNRYSEDSLASKINDLLIDGSLMAHQLYINNNKDKDKDKDKDINKSKIEKKPKIEILESESQFETFWNLYDKKTGRAEVEKKFKAAIKKDSFENIIAGLHKYISSRSSDSKFWKNPSTWLNQECWKDEYESKNNLPPQSNKNESLCVFVNNLMKDTLIKEITTSASNKAILYFGTKEDFEKFKLKEENVRTNIKTKIANQLGTKDFEVKY